MESGMEKRTYAITTIHPAQKATISRVNTAKVEQEGSRCANIARNLMPAGNN